MPFIDLDLIFSLGSKVNRYNTDNWLPALAATFLVLLQTRITDEVPTTQGRHKLQHKDAASANRADTFFYLLHFHVGSQSETKFDI